MKCVFLLLALYILLLPLLPCADMADSAAPSVPAATAAPATHDHEDEACSPFCSCACCGTVLVSLLQSAALSTLKPMVKPTKPSPYNSIILTADYFGNIWQPPRVEG